jgi:hypothetical protein
VGDFILRNLVEWWQHVLASVDSLVYSLCVGESRSIPSPTV